MAKLGHFAKGTHIFVPLWWCAFATSKNLGVPTLELIRWPRRGTSRKGGVRSRQLVGHKLDQ